MRAKDDEVVCLGDSATPSSGHRLHDLRPRTSLTDGCYVSYLALCLRRYQSDHHQRDFFSLRALLRIYFLCLGGKVDCCKCSQRACQKYSVFFSPMVPVSTVTEFHCGVHGMAVITTSGVSMPRLRAPALPLAYICFSVPQPAEGIPQ